MIGPRVVGPVPGPRSSAIAAREAALLAPGVQQISTLAGIAVDGGEGALLRDADGNVFLDFFAGMGVASIGHGHPALVEALARQAARVSSTSFASEARANLLERIALATASIGAGRLDRTQLYSGGAETVESALRLARAATGRRGVIAFHGAFHGKTAGVLGLMGLPFKEGLGPFLDGQHLAPYPDRFRDATLSSDACLAALEALIALKGAPAAILVEPMQGTAGNVIPPADFLRGLRRVADRHGALLVADEMITGWGRTGRLFAVEHAQVEPDILCFGKGVANGYPVSGLTTRKELARHEPWSRPSFSSSSYGGSPLACAAADAVTRVIVDERLTEHAARIGALLLDELTRLAGKHPTVAEVRGRGLLIAVELVADRDTRTPLAPAACERLFRACLRRGLLALTYAPRVRINPPLVLTEAQALKGVRLLDAALDELEADRAR